MVMGRIKAAEILSATIFLALLLQYLPEVFALLDRKKYVKYQAEISIRAAFAALLLLAGAMGCNGFFVASDADRYYRHVSVLQQRQRTESLRGGKLSSTISYWKL